ncbi:MAG: hypothetical protein JXK93_06570 [Sphaerochaetaceae bacterium]|nr:hypothetical protein [Sphaerochaetaceae bacterium]
MKKGLAPVILMLFLSSVLFGQRTLFVGTIPLNGSIPLQETFSVDVTFSSGFLFSQEVAGNEYQIATYQFSSNSPFIQYQMKLSPGSSASAGPDLFAFRNITADGQSAGGLPIPFSIRVRNFSVEETVASEGDRALQKKVGVLEGSQYTEVGSISVAFPTRSEGFNIEEFSSGLYEASILVEVLAD